MKTNLNKKMENTFIDLLPTKSGGESTSICDKVLTQLKDDFNTKYEGLLDASFRYMVYNDGRFECEFYLYCKKFDDRINFFKIHFENKNIDFPFSLSTGLVEFIHHGFRVESEQGLNYVIKEILKHEGFKTTILSLI